MSRLPHWLRIAFTLWILLWVPVYLREYGAVNFLWLCDLGNFVLLAAIWLESPLLASSQAAGLLVFQSLWAIDFAGGLFGHHPIGGTEYMFDPAIPLAVRALSLFHLVAPPLMLWLVRRLGYDPRGWRLQSALTAVAFFLAYLLSDPVENVDWMHRPFGLDPSPFPPWAIPVLGIVLVPALLYWPTHLLLARGSRGRTQPAG